MSNVGSDPIGTEKPEDGESKGLSTDSHERLVAAGLVLPGPKPSPISELKLTPLGMDSSRAVRAILQDRGL